VLTGLGPDVGDGNSLVAELLQELIRVRDGRDLIVDGHVGKDREPRSTVTYHGSTIVNHALGDWDCEESCEYKCSRSSLLQGY
jgi:hypothetical protein